MSEPIVLRRGRFASRGCGWADYDWSRGSQGHPFAEGSRAYASLQGVNAHEAGKQLAKRVRAEIEKLEPAALVYMEMGWARCGDQYARVLVALHGDAIGLPNLGPTHLARKSALMAPIQRLVEAIVVLDEEEVG